jgi:hypothetical protein
MATATVITKTVTTVTEVPDGVTLTLSPEEAQIIFNYTTRASGIGPLRDASNNVWEALRPHVKCDTYGNPPKPIGFAGYITHDGHH